MYKEHIAIDQWGNKEFLGPHPRAELIRKFGYKHVSKMYRTIGGVDCHVGWIIGPHWWEVMRLSPLDPAMPDPKPAKEKGIEPDLSGNWMKDVLDGECCED